MDSSAEEKHKTIEELTKLSEACWTEYDTRRSYEWKVSFGLWTAIGIILGFAFKQDISLPFNKWWIIPILFLVLAAYLLFHFGLRNSNKNDQAKRHAYFKVIHEQTGFFPMFDNAINNFFEKKEAAINEIKDNSIKDADKLKDSVKRQLAIDNANTKAAKALIEVEKDKLGAIKARMSFEKPPSTSADFFLINWSHSSQIAITTILLFLLGAVLINNNLENKKGDGHKYHSNKKIEYPIKHDHLKRF